MTRSASVSPDAIEATMLRLAAESGPEKSIGPADVARVLGGPHPDGWGPLMQPVRRVAVRLMKEGRILILRKGRPVDDPDEFRGVYRLALAPGAAGDGAGNGSSI
jgi:hypothetical protein